MPKDYWKDSETFMAIMADQIEMIGKGFCLRVKVFVNNILGEIPSDDDEDNDMSLELMGLLKQTGEDEDQSTGEQYL